jgi:glycosyltransferase involved in cell wall biosynthesis
MGDFGKSVSGRPWPSFAVVLPAFNEAGRIGAVVKAVRGYSLHVVVVDDGSGDATAAEAEAAGAIVVRHGKNRGKGVALQSGMDHVAGMGLACVITMDSDGQHAPEDIPAFLDGYLSSGAPVVMGNRMAGDTSVMPRDRYLTNRFMSWLLSCRMGQRVPDTQCGYRLYRLDMLPYLRTRSGGFAAESEVLIRISRGGFKIASVPIRVIYGTEVSKIRPVRDTFRFIGMLFGSSVRKA